MSDALNVLGEPLEPCCNEPLTGFYRDGYCNTGLEDLGSHTVCCVVNENFLRYSQAQGNDLSTPRPEFNFPGLKPGDGWCVCAARWYQAYQDGMAPPVKLASTHQKALEIVPKEALLELAFENA